MVAEGNEEISETDNSLRNQVIKLNGKSNVLKTTLDATISELTDFEGQTSSKFEQTAESMEAKVSKEGGNPSSFGWKLLDDHFSLISRDKEVFRSSEDGVKIDGYVDAQSFIGQEAKINEIIADNVLIHGELNADSARFNALEADNATIHGTLEAQGGVIIGVGDRVTAIENDYVTTGTLDAHEINADKINSGSIALSKVQVDGKNAVWQYHYVQGQSSHYWIYVLCHA